jgi:hypothetical protein
METLLLFLLQGIPESSGYIALSLALLGVPLRWKRIVVAGTVLALIFFTVRSLSFSFGIHTAIGIFSLIIAINRTTNIPLTKTFIAVLASFTTLALLEIAISEAFFTLTKIDPQSFIAGHKLYWKLLGLPQAFLLLFFAWLISKFKKPQEAAWKI